MWPWGHLAVGYLLYSLYTHRRFNRPPQDYTTLALVVGTQFPDLLDKPLAWTLGLLPTGRSLTHSLLTALLIIVLLRVLVRHHTQRPLVAAFSLGYLSHLAADSLYSLIVGEYYYLGFLAWPVIPAIEYPTDKSFAGHVVGIELTPYFLFQLVLFGLALGVWRRDGAPGLAAARRVPARAYHAVTTRW